MGDPGAVRAGPYETGVVLGWIGAHWLDFDGWCAARGVDPADLPFARGCALYLYSLRDGADEKRNDEIDEALTPPPGWRNPLTGLPAGFDDEADEWALWESATR